MTLSNQDLTTKVRAIEQFTSNLSLLLRGDGSHQGVIEQLANQQTTLNGLLSTVSNSPPSPVANLLLNGELGHSVFTWNTVPPPTSPTNPTETAQNEECQQWYSHQTPALAQTFTSVDVNTGTDQITIADHGFTTGCTVDLLEEAGGTLPAPLVVGTTYWLIVINSNTLQFAMTLANAEAGTQINLTTIGTAAKTYTIQQRLLDTNSLTSTTNNALKTEDHVNYDPRYGKWDAQAGEGVLHSTTTIDALMPVNNVDATTPLARISLIAARRIPEIEIPSYALMAAGIWDNTSGQRKFLTGEIGFTAQTVGTPGLTHRNFRVLLTSDRGYSLLSDEVVIINAPADGAFSSTSNIAMSWKQQAGQLQVAIYEHYDPGGAGDEYRLIANVSSATGFIYLGDHLETVAGYPTPTGTALTATFFTNTGDMSDLAVNNEAVEWDTVNFPIAVPNTYNKANTTDRQWVRLWMTSAPNLLIDQHVTTAGTDTITIPSGILDTAQYGTGVTSLYAGLEAQVMNSVGGLIQVYTIVSVTNDTTIVLDDTVAAGTNRQLRIVGGGFHGILLDKIHLGYQQNTSYAPNALDVRNLQPRAAPNGSNQGGVGGGGSGGGIVCVAFDTPVKLNTGEWVPIQRARVGRLWASAGLKPNILKNITLGFAAVRRVRTKNGCEIFCTDTERFVTCDTDHDGTKLQYLREGDTVLTEINGRVEASKIMEIGSLLPKTQVFTPHLSDNNLYIAGKWQPKWWQRGRQKKGGFVLHNRKFDP